MNVCRIKALFTRVLLTLLAGYSIAFSQEPALITAERDSQKDSATKSAPRQLADWLDVSFSTRLRYETVDHRFKAGEDPSDQQLPMRTRVGIGIKDITGPFRLLMEFEDSRVFLTDSRSTVNVTMRDEHDVLQAYVAIDFNRKAAKGPKHTLYVGRQSFDLGSRRLFARNRFRNSTNHFDGLRFTSAAAKKWSLDAFFLGPMQMEMHNLDRPAHGTYIWGGYFALTPRFGGSAETYYLGFYTNPLSSGLTRVRNSTLGVRLYRANELGRFGYEVESAWQFGKTGRLDHFAHFQHLQLGYTFNTPWEFSITGMYDYASGDRDPQDDKSGNFNFLFGARRWEFGPTGILNWMYRSNINSPALFVGLKPAKKLEFLPMLRWLRLAQAPAPWVGTGLVDSSGASGTDVGKSLELRLRYRFAPYLRPEIGYLHFFKGTYPALVPRSPATADTNYFFVEMELQFEDLFQKKKK